MKRSRETRDKDRCVILESERGVCYILRVICWCRESEHARKGEGESSSLSLLDRHGSLDPARACRRRRRRRREGQTRARTCQRLTRRRGPRRLLDGPRRDLERTVRVRRDIGGHGAARRRQLVLQRRDKLGRRAGRRRAVRDPIVGRLGERRRVVRQERRPRVLAVVETVREVLLRRLELVRPVEPSGRPSPRDELLLVERLLERLVFDTRVEL